MTVWSSTEVTLDIFFCSRATLSDSEGILFIMLQLKVAIKSCALY